MIISLLVLEVFLLVSLSAACSGLNVALMSLQPSDLKRKAKIGDKRARKVLPFRLNNHLTLSSILFTNVAVISATSLILEHHTTGLIAGLISTILIVIFGEVLPQAWFSRYALTFCAKLSPMLRLMIIFSYPVAKPLQLILDKMLGDEHYLLHSRGELGLIIREHSKSDESELDEDELEIMKGALSLSEKRVNSIMTPLEQVYWLNPETLLDGGKINEIKAEGWSRIPILGNIDSKFHGILLMKDLVDVDFDEEPIYIEDLPLHKCATVGSMTALDTMFRKFIVAKTHLMPVEREGKIVGIVTIEDLLEEILGHEIEDESDHTRKNNHKKITREDIS